MNERASVKSAGRVIFVSEETLFADALLSALETTTSGIIFSRIPALSALQDEIVAREDTTDTCLICGNTIKLNKQFPCLCGGTLALPSANIAILFHEPIEDNECTRSLWMRGYSLIDVSSTCLSSFLQVLETIRLGYKVLDFQPALEVEGLSDEHSSQQGPASVRDLFIVGGIFFTKKQRDVMMLVKEGCMNKEIAYRLGIGEAAVKARLAAIFRKLGCTTRTEVAIAAHSLEALTQIDDSCCAHTGPQRFAP